jgi:hypothetical protein
MLALLEPYVRLLQLPQGYQRRLFLQQILLPSHGLPQTVNISSTLVTTMEPLLGHPIQRPGSRMGLAEMLLAYRRQPGDERKDLLCSLYPGNDHYRGTRFQAT